MKKYILGFVSILLLVAVSGCFKGGGERIQKKLSKELSLNDSQKKIRIAKVANSILFMRDSIQEREKRIFKLYF